MTPEQEEELARQYPRNMGQSDVWYFLFRLLVPGMRNLSIAEIRAQYPSPCKTRNTPDTGHRSDS